jgi:tRNA modification GTPase
VKIVDTAGIRETENLIEKIGIEKSIQAIEESDIVLALFDSSETLQTDDFKIIELLEKYKSSRKILPILNKSDLHQVLEKISDFETLNISTMNFDNSLIEQLQNILTEINTSSDGGTILSSIRQIDEVEKTISEIEQAKIPLENGELEFFSFHIQEAIERISAISRPYQYSEMLDEMFGNFCLGK